MTGCVPDNVFILFADCREDGRIAEICSFILIIKTKSLHAQVNQSTIGESRPVSWRLQHGWSTLRHALAVWISGRYHYEQ